MSTPTTRHDQPERPTRLSPEVDGPLPGGNLRWIVAFALLGVVALGTAAAVAIG